MSKNRLLLPSQRRPDPASTVSHSMSLSCRWTKPPSLLRVARNNIAPSFVEAVVMMAQRGPEERISWVERGWAH